MNPDLFAGGGVERHERIVAREHVGHVVGDQRPEPV
jgi:hypothetical protein